jgi:hypothetical protein
MREYLYVLIRADGSATPLDNGHANKDLAALLKDGWEPMRETAAPVGVQAACFLVLLYRGGLYD